ncbi:MAG: phosphopyruvate hydratase [Bdellovibrionales bacterium]|nr:phosphopyruvate hydratase [Bdellovibrionales bacterium]
MNITSIQARSILDSRGNPTIEVDLCLDGSHFGRAAVPSGASTGSREALELRDHDLKQYCGKGVQKALSHIETRIKPLLLSQKWSSQKELDQAMIELDGSENKSSLGANAILGISMAFAKALSQRQSLHLYESIGNSDRYILPCAMMNVINGGAHASNALDFQEFMLVPHGFERFSDSLRAGVEVFHQLKKTLHKKGLSTNVGDEGGFAPQIESVETCLEMILASIENAGYQAGKHISLALDVAASEFYTDGKYTSKKSKSFDFDSSEMINWYEKLCTAYPIVSIEDPLAEDDWEAWKLLSERLGEKIQIVGDDLFVTNPKILQRGIDQGIANAILIKLNQIGTVSETLEAIEMAQKATYGVVISHRSGETEDTFIADLSVGTHAGQIKTGSLSRSDRVAKYNQLLRIEEQLKDVGLAKVFSH